MKSLRLLALALACSLFSTSLPAAEKLNLLLITADDLGLQLSCYGNQVIQTPNLDRLAASGTQFKVAYVTQASCSPSRSSLFLGTYPHTNGHVGLANTGFSLAKGHRQGDRSLPGYLKQAGYRTGILGKLHVAPESIFPFDFRQRVNTRDVRAVASKARGFMAAGGDPFFLMVNYSDPHAARLSKQSRDWFFPAQIKGVPADPIAEAAAPPLPFQQLTDASQIKRTSNYYNTVKRLDAGIGMLLDALEATGQAEQTVIVFAGDHGPPFARGKTTCYEAGLRIPLLVKWPGVASKQQSEALVSTIDVMPTLLDAARIEIPEHLQGRSLRPVLTSAKAPWREYLVGEFHYHGQQPFYPRRAIRDDRYKLIHNLRAGKAKPSTGVDGDPAYRLSRQEKYAGTAVREAFDTFADPPEYELYDLKSDPWEMHNRSDDPQLEEVKARLQEALLDWRKRMNDPLLTAAGMAAMAELP